MTGLTHRMLSGRLLRRLPLLPKTDSTNLRIAYAANQMIFNWERDQNQLRINGGPANGLHKAGAGNIPTGKYVTIRWLVTPDHQDIYVDGELRFEHSGDYSKINRCVSVFPAVGSKVTVKSIIVKPLSPPQPVAAVTVPQPEKVEVVSAGQIQKWVGQLADSDFSKRESAVNELARHPADALPALEQVLQTETDSDRRWWIQSAIQACEENQPKPGRNLGQPGQLQRSSGIRRACKSGDGFFTTVERNGVDCWEVPKKGSYLYFSASDAFRQKTGSALEIQVEYLDIGTGTIGLDYDSSDKRSPFGEAYEHHFTFVHCTNSGQWRREKFHLSNARFRGSENCQTDFRFYNGGDDMIIRSVRVWPAPK